MAGANGSTFLPCRAASARYVLRARMSTTELERRGPVPVPAATLSLYPTTQGPCRVHRAPTDVVEMSA